MRVKVCGMTQQHQLDELSEIGVDFAGFIFYPKSPRYVLKSMTTAEIKKENRLNKVGVFVNASVEEVLRTVDECRLHMVQLHGDENPKECEKIADYITVVKAFRMSDNDVISWKVKPYIDACDMFMFDTMGAGYGGTGKKFDWNVLTNESIVRPFFLSGGIEPGDAAQLKSFAHMPVSKNLFAVDINSRFEITPGIKDMEKVRNFVTELKS